PGAVHDGDQAAELPLPAAPAPRLPASRAQLVRLNLESGEVNLDVVSIHEAPVHGDEAGIHVHRDGAVHGLHLHEVGLHLHEVGLRLRRWWKAKWWRRWPR